MYWCDVSAVSSSGLFPCLLKTGQRHPIPKGPSSYFVANFRLISVTPVFSKVRERVVSVRLGRIRERSGVLPTTQFAYLKSLGICDVFLCVSHTVQSASESLQNIDFSAACEHANHARANYYVSTALWILEVLCCLYC